MKKPSKRVLGILAGMSVEEKVGQLSCIMPILVMKGGKVSQEKMDAVIPRSIGRMTQFSTGFLAGPRAAAEGYNEIQRHALEKQPSKVPVMVQNESAAGLMAAGATVFPVPVAVASSWQPELAGDMGRIIREEGKAIGVHVAMSPVADVARDSRWGRVSETFGEDPMLAARFSAEKAKGIQGEDYRENILSMAKHFMGYGMSEVGVNAAVIPMGKKELFEVYGTPFAAAIKEADMQSVMVTYSEIDGLPMSVNEHYMRKVLREDMGFNGVAVCDGGSIPRVQQQQGLYHSLEELAGRALRAGIDADTPFTMVYTSIKSGIEKGLVDEKDLDESVLRILTHKEELGLLDDPFVDPEEAARIYARPDGRRVSEEIAQKEITLLKNKDKLLPLKKDTKKLALIGPFGGRLSTLFGGYAYPSMLEMFIGACLGVYGHMMEGFAELFGEILDKEDIIRTLGLDLDKSYEENLDGFIRRAYDTKTLKEAMGDAMPDCDIAFHRGVGTGEDWKQEIGEAVAAARDSEVILVAVGEVTGFGAGATSGEGVNNPDLRLPGHQQQLLEALAELGKPIVMVLFNGRALALADAEPLCDAILEVWYPGPYGAPVVAQALTGDLNPGGKLPVTFPQISAQCPVYYGHKTGSGYLDKDQKPVKGVLQPLYPFGYGLSYTSFEIDNLQLDESAAVGGTFTLSVDVQNTGERPGDEVVQVYTHTKQPTVVRPVKELRAFRRVTLAPGQKRTLRFTLDTRQFGYLDKDDRFVVEPSALDVLVGNSSSDIAQRGVTTLTGETKEMLRDRVFGFGVEEL